MRLFAIAAALAAASARSLPRQLSEPGADARTMPGTLPDADTRGDMLKIINSAFAKVPADDGYRLEPVPTTDASWISCSKIDYSEQNCFETEGKYICDTSTEDVKAQLRILGVAQCFEPGKPADSSICQAIHAFLDAHATLTSTYSMGPGFSNSEIVKWTSETVPSGQFGDFPSWREDGITADLATDTKQGSATWNNLGEPWGQGNAVNGYAVCEIITTILQQTNNQAGTGTCGPSAIFAALNYHQPITSLQDSLELLWTGENHRLPGGTCPYILANIPGLILPPQRCPLDDGTCPAYQKCVDNGGNSGDCKLLAGGNPLNPIGIQSMSTQAWQSNYFASFDPQSCEKEPLGMNWQGADLTAVRLAQQSSPSLIMYLCKHLLAGGEECPYLSNVENVDLLPPIKAQHWVTLPELTGTDLGELQECLSNPSTVAACIGQKMATNARINTFVAGIYEDAEDNQGDNALLQVFGSIQPSMTGEILDEACNELSSTSAMFFIDGDYIKSNDNPTLPYADPTQVPLAPWDDKKTAAAEAYPGGNGVCDHWIMLEACNSDDTFTFFTWGWKIKMSKAFILGGLTPDPKKGVFCGHVRGKNPEPSPLAPPHPSTPPSSPPPAPSFSPPCRKCPSGTPERQMLFASGLECC